MTKRTDLNRFDRKTALSVLYYKTLKSLIDAPPHFNEIATRH